MADINFTVVKQRVNPWVQFAMALAIGFGAILFCRITHPAPGAEYFGAMIGIIFFTLINTVVSIAYASYLRYTVPSYYLYAFLTALLFLTSKLSSGISIWKLENYREMISIITFFYFIVSLLVRLMRAIFILAEGDKQ